MDAKEEERRLLSPTDAGYEQRTSARTAVLLAIYSVGAYLAMNGMRRPLGSLTLVSEEPLLGLSPKVAMAMAQTSGYAAGKLWGVLIVGRVPRTELLRTLLLAGITCVLGWAGVVWLPRGVLTLLSVFAGSFPVAACWSLMFRYIEGRRCSDAVGGAFGISITLGPGFAKLAGSTMRRLCGIGEGAAGAHLRLSAVHCTEWSVPLLAAGGIFPVYAFCLCSLDALPGPTAAEKEEMGDRAHEAAGGGLGHVLRLYWPGVLCVCVSNALFLSARELRDVFQPELWMALYGAQPTPLTFILTGKEGPALATASTAPCRVITTPALRVHLWRHPAMTGPLRSTRTKTLARRLTQRCRPRSP